MYKRLFLSTGYLALGLFLTRPAYAHPGHGEADLVNGFIHPITGVDHLLAMVLVGMIAGRIGGRALYTLPSAFLCMMIAGAASGISGTQLPFFEVGITLSLIVFGLLLASNARLGTAIASVLAGAFAVFHGYAHGSEMPLSSDAIGYAAGFLAATALLHLLGIVIYYASSRFGQTLKVLPRLVGGVSMVFGAMLATGLA